MWGLPLGLHWEQGKLVIHTKTAFVTVIFMYVQIIVLWYYLVDKEKGKEKKGKK